ncbi:MAG TPA: SRPBCC family protein [Opitutus sp.]|nr:SRPBCC family protein [Opitutus sp.]
MSTKPIRAVVTRRFHAPAERVFDAWLNREMLGRWMFGPAVRDEEIVHLALTPRVGGSFSFLVERGGEDIEHLGKYLEIDRPSRLAFTWIVASEAVGSRVIVEIAPGETGCELTVTHEIHPSWAEQVGRTEQAWGKMLDTLAIALG